MSVLESLKGTVVSVQQGISAGFKSLTRSGSSEETETYCDEVNPDAGADLLNKFQEEWVQLHKNAEECGLKAQEVDLPIGDLFVTLEKHHRDLTVFHTEASKLPDLLKDIKQVMNTIGELTSLCSDVETELMILQDVCEQQELTNNKRRHDYQLGLYRQKKHVELEQVKVRLASEHAGKVQNYEKKLQSILRERQEAFEAAYTDELQHYKKYGHTNQLKPSPPPKHPVDLADISIEQDKDALDEFLKSDDGKTSATSNPKGAAKAVDVAAEGADEDDEILTVVSCFTVKPDEDFEDDVSGAMAATNENVAIQHNLQNVTETNDAASSGASPQDRLADLDDENTIVNNNTETKNNEIVTDKEHSLSQSETKDDTKSDASNSKSKTGTR